MSDKKTKNAHDTKSDRSVTDAAFKRAKATILRRYRYAFKMLAAYDRGEYKI